MDLVLTGGRVFTADAALTVAEAIALRDGRIAWVGSNDEALAQAGAGARVLDLEGRRVGRLDAPYPTNIPHPQLLPDPGGGWWMLTFDGRQFAEDVMGYGGHGDLVIMHSV